MASWNGRLACNSQPLDTRVSGTSSAHISSLPAHLQSTRQPTYVTQSHNHNAPDGNLLIPRFPCKLFNVLEGRTLETWIRWHQDGGLLIPNVDHFVEHALPICFPEMKNGWGSFQKQLCNYGFEKQNRNKNRALYAHWDNKFCSGRPDLLSQVKRRSRDLIQEQPPAPNTHPVPQPLGPLNPDARIEFLEKQLEMTQNKVSELERLLQEMGTLVKQISSKLDAALSVRNSSPNSQVYTGLVEETVRNQYSMGEEGHSSSVHDGFTPEPSIGAYDDGAQLRGLPSHMGPGAPLTTIDPALLQLPARHQLPTHHQLPDNTTSFACPSRIPHHAAGLSAVAVPFLMQDSSTYGAGPTSLSSYARQQNAGPSAGAPTFPPNGFVPAPTSPTQVHPQSSNSSRTLSGRKPFGGLCPVPRRSPPGPSRSGHFPFGSTNAGY